MDQILRCIEFGSISFFQNGLACNVVEEIDSYCLNLSIQITSTADTDMSVHIVTKEQRMPNRTFQLREVIKFECGFADRNNIK